MCEHESGSDSSGVACPTCGGEFKNDRGVKVHHARAHGESIAGKIVACMHCGEDYRARLDHLRDNDKNFCSYKCHREYKKDVNRKTVACGVCGDELTVHNYRLKDTEEFVCSDNCLGKLLRSRGGENHPLYSHVTLSCESCGDEFEVKPSDEDQRRFCSHGCWREWLSENRCGENHWNWVGGGKVYYGSGFTYKKKEQVRERQDRRCAHCSKSESENGCRLSVHHVQKARSFDDSEERNDESNLVALCRPCHAKWEKMSPLRPQTD